MNSSYYFGAKYVLTLTYSLSKLNVLDLGLFASEIYADDCIFEDPTIKFRGKMFNFSFYLPPAHVSSIM